MIDREKLKSLLIERAKEAGVYSDTPEFAKHLESEVVEHLTDDKSDHESELNLQIKLIRQHNVALKREPYQGYPWKEKLMPDGSRQIVNSKDKAVKSA